MLPEKPPHKAELSLAVLWIVLWIRQLRYERRLSNRQGRWEREIVREFKRFGEQNWRWSERLVKQINKALGGARR